jgi:thiol-disulfide isomerase/thioredoxin
MTFQALLRLDLLLFSATAAAFVGHLYSTSSQRSVSTDTKKRRSRSQKQVSFRSDMSTDIIPSGSVSSMDVHSSIQDMMPSIFAFGTLPSSTKIIGLLFAAKWCPDCTNVVPAIGKVTDETALTSLIVEPTWLQIVYISSDVDEETIQQFKPSTMLHIPYDAVEERRNIKRKYNACAAKEMEILDMQQTRVHGIPTLILLKASTGAILTENGVEDVMNSSTPDQVLEQWKNLLDE